MEYSISAACKRAVSQSEAQRRTRRRRMPLSRDLLIGLALGSLATYFHLESRPSDGRQLQAEPPPSCRISTLPESRLPWSAADQARMEQLTAEAALLAETAAADRAEADKAKAANDTVAALSLSLSLSLTFSVPAFPSLFSQ